MKKCEKGAWPWSRDLLFQFLDPNLSRERLMESVKTNTTRH